jgi:tetratricopeptide (TPR) repeat protein
MTTTPESSVRERAAGELNDEQRRQYDQIVDEIDPMAEGAAVSSALGQLDRMLDQMPDARSHRHLRAGLHALRASLLLDADRSEEALRSASAAIDAGWKDADVFETAGWAAYSLDRPGAARDHFNRALKLDEDLVSALSGRALALQENDELEQARADLSHAINIDSDDPSLYAMRAEIQIGLGHLEEAQRDVGRARELAPREPEHAVDLARLLMVQGEIDEALDALESGTAEEDAALETLLLRSHLRLLGGDSDGAKRDAIRASNAYPDEAFAFVQLVHVEMAEGNLKLAQKAADRAVRLDPSLPDGYLVRGSVRQMLGEAAEANEDLERARQAPAELPMFLLGPFYDRLDQTGYDASMANMLQQYAQMGQPGGATGQTAGQSASDAQQAQPGAGQSPLGGMEGLGGLADMPGVGDGDGPPDPSEFDPSEMMEQMFDDSGELDDRVRPLLEMAMKNAPNLLQNMPSGMLENMAGIDPDDLEDLDMENMDSDEFERRMKKVYEMLQGGNNPFDMFGGFGGGGSDSESSDDDD